MHSHDSPSLGTLIQFARSMRERPTRSEALLWAQLRGRKLGVRSRRQHPLDRYVLDFYAPCARVCVEVDGSSHDARARYDEARDEVLRMLGIRVVRISASLVERDVLVAVVIIRSALA